MITNGILPPVHVFLKLEFIKCVYSNHFHSIKNYNCKICYYYYYFSFMEDVKVAQSVSLITLDHYMGNPINGLDLMYSEFWGTQIVKVPILRVFGSTPEGNFVSK